MVPIRSLTRTRGSIWPVVLARGPPNRSGDRDRRGDQSCMSEVTVEAAVQGRGLWWRGVVPAFVLWLVPSTGLILKYTGVRGLIFLPIVGLSAIAILTAILCRRTVDLSARWLVGVGGLAVLLFALLHPLAHSGLLGPGSDREDGLNVALHALVRLHDPYSTTSFLGHQLNPMPGALILALPFYLIGNSAFQNLFWVPVLLMRARKWFGTTSAALWCGLVFIVGCPASLRDFVTGGDYLINALYVAIAMDLVVVAGHQERKWYRYAAAIFFSVAISSRPNYLVAVPILAGAVFQSRGWQRMVEFLALVALGCFALQRLALLPRSIPAPDPAGGEQDVGYPALVSRGDRPSHDRSAHRLLQLLLQNGPSAHVRSDRTFPSAAVLPRSGLQDADEPQIPRSNVVRIFVTHFDIWRDMGF